MTWKEGEVKLLLFCFTCNKPIGNLFKIIDEVDKISPDDIDNVIEKHFETHIQRENFPDNNDPIICRYMFIREVELKKKWFYFPPIGNNREVITPASYKQLSNIFEYDSYGNMNKTYDDD